MITLTVNAETDKLKKNFLQLNSENTRKAIVSAINRTLLKGRTEARKEVKAVYNIPQKNLAGIDIERATSSLMIGKLGASAKPIPMDAFSPRFETNTGSITISKKGVQKSKDFKRAKSNAAVGVSVEIIKGQRTSVPYAFMIKGAKPRVFARGAYKGGGNWGFIQRHKRSSSTGADTPIKPLISVTVHGAVINDKAMGNLSSSIQTFYTDRLMHELQFQVDKMQP